MKSCRCANVLHIFQLSSKRQYLSAWVLIGFFFCFNGRIARAADDSLELEEPSNWTHFFDVRTEFGYRDNITYSSNNPQESAFGLLHLEYTLLRLPVDEWQVIFLSSNDGTRFVDTSMVDHELLSFNLLQVRREKIPGRIWELGLQHVYQDQVVDAAGTVVNSGATAIRGNTLMAYSQWKQQWPDGWWLAGRPKFEWQTLQLPLDDSYAPGFEASFGRDFGDRMSLSLAYHFEERVFSQYTPTTALGASTGTGELHFREHGVDAFWRMNLDTAKHWRLTARNGWRRQLDNGANYYGYDRFRTALELRWKKKPWEIRLSGSASFYDYQVQTVAGIGTERREKELLSIGGQVRRDIGKGWYGLVKAEHEESLSNLALDRYSATLVSIGLGWER